MTPSVARGEGSGPRVARNRSPRPKDRADSCHRTLHRSCKGVLARGGESRGNPGSPRDHPGRGFRTAPGLTLAQPCRCCISIRGPGTVPLRDPSHGRALLCKFKDSVGVPRQFESDHADPVERSQDRQGRDAERCHDLLGQWFVPLKIADCLEGAFGRGLGTAGSPLGQPVQGEANALAPPARAANEPRNDIESEEKRCFGPAWRLATARTPWPARPWPTAAPVPHQTRHGYHNRASLAVEFDAVIVQPVEDKTDARLPASRTRATA